MWHFTIYGGYSLLNSSQFPGTATNGSITLDGKISSTYENSGYGGAEIGRFKNDAIFVKAGARAMPYRLVKSANFISDSGMKQTVPITNPYSYKLTSYYVDAGYSEKSVYIFTGLHYAVFDFSFPSSTVPFKPQNGFGLQFGIGYLFDDMFSVEALLAATAVGVASGADYSTQESYTFTDLMTAFRISF